MAYLKTKAIVHGDLSARNVLVSIASDSSDVEANKSTYILQVADFGLAQIVSSVVSDGNESNSPKIPIKWAAIELVEWALYEAKKELESVTKSSDYNDQERSATITKREAPKICEQTDVWSLGVTIWEICNYGRSPYFKLFNEWKPEAWENIADIIYNNKNDPTKEELNYYVLENIYVLERFYDYLKGNGKLSRPKNSNGELWTIMTLCNILVLLGWCKSLFVFLNPLDVNFLQRKFLLFSLEMTSLGVHV
jgi:serine/threonine protein kinase